MVAARPVAINASGANLGGLAHLSVAGLLTSLQRPVPAMPWVPLEGSASSLQQLKSGAIDVVATTRPDAQTMVDAGRLRSIATMKPVRDPAYPDVPTVKDRSASTGA